MPQNTQPAFNPIPTVVWVLFLFIMLIEVLFTLGDWGLLNGYGGILWRMNAISTYGFSGVAFDWMLLNGKMPFEYSIRTLTYMFIHKSFIGALFGGVLLLAMGKLVGEVMGQFAVFVLFVLSGVFGVCLFGLLTNQSWLIGAYPGVYGLIGAYTFLMWQRLDQQGGEPLLAFRLIGFLIGVQLLFGVLFATGLDWVAELAGFVCGFGLSVIVMPGGLARIRALIQRK